MITSAFPVAVRAIRQMHQLSQADLAAELGHSQGWCSRIEAGDREPSLADLELLSHRYGLRLEHGEWHVGVLTTSETNS